MAPTSELAWREQNICSNEWVCTHNFSISISEAEYLRIIPDKSTEIWGWELVHISKVIPQLTASKSKLDDKRKRIIKFSTVSTSHYPLRESQILFRQTYPLQKLSLFLLWFRQKFLLCHILILTYKLGVWGFSKYYLKFWNDSRRYFSC